MLKLLPVIVVVLVILGVSGYLIFNSKPTPQTAATNANAPIPLPSAPALTTLQTQKLGNQTEGERIRLLEQSVLELKAQLDSVNSKPVPVTTSTTTEIANLQSQINTLKTTIGQAAAPASTNQSTIYIPLGDTGTSSSLTYATINDIQIALNPASFPGYTSMQLEVMLQAYQGNGTAYAQLYNYDDGTAIQGSAVSTTSQTYTLVSSGNFTLPSGTKNYRLQLMTTTGYAASLSMARLKVNF